MQTAYQYHQAGRYADAARAYQALLEQNPDDVSALLHLFGVLHQQCGYPARAVELISRAISLRPDVASFQSNLAEAHRSLKQYKQATDCCHGTALSLQPDYPEAATTSAWSCTTSAATRTPWSNSTRLSSCDRVTPRPEQPGSLPARPWQGRRGAGGLPARPSASIPTWLWPEPT